MLKFFREKLKSTLKGIQSRRAANERAVEAAYKALLTRAPDAQGRSYYLQHLQTGRMDLEQMLCSLVQSREGVRRNLDRLSPQGFNSAPSDILGRLRGGAITRADFDKLWQETMPDEADMVIGQKAYLEVHKQRFYELANAVLHLLPPEGKLLEFGVSEFSRMYQRLCPNGSIVTADRPTTPDYPGFTPWRCLRALGGRAHFSIDLESRHEKHWEPLQAAGPYDLVVFAEVLEHLQAEPVALMRDLLGLLAANGVLYLTTPNFFRQENLEKLAEGLNPQPYYPGPAENWDAHYHYREYTMMELEQIVEQARGVRAAAYFSDCWQDPSGALVLIAGRPGCVVAGMSG